MVIRDERYGKNGKVIWAFLAGPAIFLGIVLVSLYALFFEDFWDAKSVWITIFGAMLFFLYFLISNIQILTEAPRVAQLIECNGKIRIRFYFGREVIFAVTDVTGVDVYKTNRWLKFSTLLSFVDDNYIIRLRDGRAIYIAGFLPGVSDFIDSVKNQ